MTFVSRPLGSKRVALSVSVGTALQAEILNSKCSGPEMESFLLYVRNYSRPV